MSAGAPAGTTARVPARIHLAGNPSDGYGGAVLSTVVPELAATVRATRDRRFSVTGPARSWRTLAQLADDTARQGHEGGDRLVTAALATLHRLLPASLERAPLALEWETTIPRSVGLGGSSAIVVATMEAALGAWGLDVPDHELAEAALVAETEELGIAAGLADRVAQVTQTTVLTDCRGPHTRIERVPIGAPVEVVLAWNAEAAAPSGDYHAGLRARADDPDVRAAMADLARLADAAADALTAGDRAAFADALDASLRAREALGPVPPAALAPVPTLRAAGAKVNFAGSGGALVIVGGRVEGGVPDGWDGLTVRLR